ncbi:MAG: glycoside hydrolase family 31 protein [Chlorobi bacterium]|nr:glycoside hydrolase family 31 protein [Chlorobiota bacterium]
MKTRFFIPCTALITVLIFSGCSTRIRLNDRSNWKITISKDTFSMELRQPETEHPVLFTGKENPALFYYTEAGIQYPLKLEQILQNTPSAYAIRYLTTDNRKMTVGIKRTARGILRLRLEISPEKGVTATGVSIKAFPEEHFYGLLERTVDGPQSMSWSDTIRASLGIRGQKITMEIKPTLGIYEPFYVSSCGYGLFVHGTQPGKYDMAASDPEEVSLAFEGNQIYLSVIPGPEPVKITQKFATLSGYSFLPPKWAFLPFRWRDEHTNNDRFYDGTPNTSPYNSMVVEDILMAEALDIPIGTYWVDRPWATGTRGYGDFRKWDPVRFPDAQGMINWINNRGQHFMVWVAPWVCDSLRDVAIKKNYLMPLRKGDSIPPNPWILDYTGPEVSLWWGEQLRPLISMGVAAFKMDRSEEKTVRSDDILLNGKTAREMRNDYPRLYMKAAYDIMKKIRGDDFLLVPRAAYTGSQQYGAFWGGDIHAGEYGLRTALIALQRCSFMNFPVWGSDIGGYWGDEFSHDNLIRWIAFGAFCPVMEVGPLHNRAPWDMPSTPSYDTILIATYRLYSKLHTELQDYSYQQALHAHNEGTPIVRPLVMAFPDDPESCKRWDEYLYGPDILVGIIWKNKQYSFDMYLPEGKWTDLWTGREYEGKQNLKIDCPEYKIPVFIRSGADLHLSDPEILYRESLERAKNVPDLQELVRKTFYTEK